MNRDIHSHSPMTRLSQPSFLSGPPQPLILTMDGQGRTPLELYRLIASPSQPSFLLDSGKGPGGGSHYSYLGSNPFSVLTGQQGQAAFRTQDGRECSSAPSLESLGKLCTGAWMEPRPGLPHFFGGAVGYLSYDFVREYEPLPSIAKDDLLLPQLQFGLYDIVTAVDHQTDRVQIMFCPPIERFLGEPREKLYDEGLDRLAEWKTRFNRKPPLSNKLPSLDQMAFHPDQTRDAYLRQVRRCQEYIAAGDIYQANLSHRFTLEPVSAYDDGVDRQPYEQELYRRLQAINPSPFSGLLHFDDVTLISASPERLIRLHDRRADTRPIAGTRPRGINTHDDRRLIGELLASEKERAEHLMLIDLERNDLGRVCRFGTVQVDEFMGIEQYSHVNHIVSNISGALKPSTTPFDLIQALFPGGTITGVPKIRCMEIIEELEPVRRGPYTGSFGYLGWNGDLDFNIVIRTLVWCGGKGYLQVGAGIVADSEPDKEYEETLQKAQAFFSVLQQT
ncbi:MAG: anthranilate synthase component I family protein [Nitrospiraceae bacterium]|nr:anthranilate synthase component I family protein [Nitrospiraceae bacterium]